MANFPYLTGRLSWENWFKQIEYIYRNNSEWFLHQLINCPKPIVPITPGNIIFALPDSYTASGSSDNLVNYDDPNINKQGYEVYDLNHNIIYQVAEHSGVFGLSTLDKLLVVNGKPLDLFYLTFYNKDGSKKNNTLFLNKF